MPICSAQLSTARASAGVRPNQSASHWAVAVWPPAHACRSAQLSSGPGVRRRQSEPLCQPLGGVRVASLHMPTAVRQLSSARASAGVRPNRSTSHWAVAVWPRAHASPQCVVVIGPRRPPASGRTGPPATGRWPCGRLRHAPRSASAVLGPGVRRRQAEPLRQPLSGGRVAVCTCPPQCAVVMQARTSAGVRPNRSTSHWAVAVWPFAHAHHSAWLSSGPGVRRRQAEPVHQPLGGGRVAVCTCPPQCVVVMQARASAGVRPNRSASHWAVAVWPFATCPPQCVSCLWARTSAGVRPNRSTSHWAVAMWPRAHANRIAQLSYGPGVRRRQAEPVHQPLGGGHVAACTCQPQCLSCIRARASAGVRPNRSASHWAMAVWPFAHAHCSAQLSYGPGVRRRQAEPLRQPLGGGRVAVCTCPPQCT